MTRRPQPAVTPAGMVPRRRRPWVLAGTAGVGLVLAVGLWLWLRPRPPVPPLPDLTDADPESAEVITAARGEVLRHPASARAWGELGMALRAHDFDPDCVACFEQAERLDPGEPRWPYLQGLTRVLTDPQTGIRCIERAVALCGDEPVAPRLRLAEALLETGRLDEAEAHLERALRLEPDNRRARLGFGRLALLKGDWQTALGQLAECVGDEHGRKLARTLRAEAWGRLGEPDRARAEQAQAAELPDDLNWPDQFIDEVLALQRGLNARLLEADSLARSGRSGDAIRVLEETAKNYPKSLQIWWKLGEQWLQQQRLDKAEQAFRQATYVDPEAAESWFRLGNVQSALKRPREAAESFRRAIRFRPGYALSHFNLAHRLLELGDPVGAAEEFRATLRCRPDYAPARDALKELATRDQRKGRQ